MFSVLYVDDENDLLELGKLFLEQSPEFHVDIASSAKEALESLSVRSYNAIVSDYQMPEIDGIAFLKLVRRKYGNIPFILFTGRGREEIVIEAINNGADFYLQKGGDVRSQFAELSHKIRQAVARWQAEYSLIDSEKRLTDIINFLPDATLAINRQGVIIAWNRAIEEMTGLSADTMIGKGDHEYALPFYGVRRPILIDLIFEPADVIEKNYSHIVREKDVLKADTTLPHLHGKEVTLAGKASPLYNSQGELIGAIEAIRDITEQKKAEDELRAAYEQITASEEELRDQLDVLEDSERREHESASRLQFMLGFYERASEGEKMLLNYAVEGAGTITGSPLGYLAFLNDDESQLTMYAWSKNAMEECSLREKPIIYKTEKTGLWGEAVRQRRAVVTNDYAAPSPAKKGYPTGHPEIVRHMNIPVIDGGHIVMVAGVANKSQDYTDEDVKQLSLLMQGLWQVIKQRQTKQELAKSEEKYRDLFENSVIGIFRTTPEGKLSAINTTFARIAGYNSTVEMLEVIQDLKTQLYVNAQDRDRFLAAISAEGIVKDFEARFYHRNGHPVWINLNAKAIRNAAGDIQYFEGTVEDIDEKKKIEGELLTEKTFSDTVIDSIPGLLYQYDSEGRLVRWNKSHETLTGYTAEELAGMNVLDWFRGDDEAIATITDGVSRALKEGEATAEAPLQTKNGKKIPFFFTAKRLEIDGKVFFIGVGLDITEKKRTADALHTAYEQLTAWAEELREQYEELAKSGERIRESEQKYRNVVDFSPFGMHFYTLHDDGSLVFTGSNPAADMILGADHRLLIGRTIEEAFPGLVNTEIPDQYRSVARNGNPLLTEQVTYDKGTIRGAFSVSAFQIQPGAMAAVFFDITERKKAEEALRLSEERFRKLISGSFDAVVVHQEGRIVLANDSAARILGIASIDDFIGKPVLELVQPEYREKVAERVRQMLKSPEGTAPLIEEKFVRLDGTTVDVEVMATTTRHEGLPAVLVVFRDISGRKKVEETLSRLSQQDREALNVARMGHFEFDVALQEFLFNDPYYAMIGITAEVAGGYRIPAKEFAQRFVFSEDSHLVEEKIKEAIDTTDPGFQIQFESRLIRPGGSVMWVMVWFRIEKDAEGKTIRFYGVNQDISEQKRMEGELREKIDEINQYFTINLDLLCIADTDGFFRRLNPEWEKALGYTLAELEGKRFLDLVHPDDLQVTLSAVGDLRSQKEVLNFINRFRHRDGTYRWLEWRSFPVGNLIYAAARDISTRKSAENALQETERKYRTLVENSQSIIYTIQPDGILTFVSPRLTVVLGYEPSEVIGHNFRSFVYKDDIAACEDFLKKTFGKGTMQPGVEYRVFHKDGSTRWHRSNITPVFDDQNTLTSFVGTAVDITEHRTMENAIRESNHKLNLLNSMTRHDVANQLTILMGYAQIASLKKGDPVIADYLGRIITAAETITRQIEFTRMYQELGVKAPVWTPLGNVIAHVESRVPVKFSGTCKGIEIFADPMLERVFFNLVDNAVRHGVRVTEITLRCEREPDGILVIMEDNGHGIPVAEKEKIFERGVGKNTGLGLFLVREILSITDITIKETGIYGKGARFEISVPSRRYRFVDTTGGSVKNRLP
jgi:PAS domain S-box-containing protein